MSSELKIRFARQADLSHLVQIYNQAVRSQTATAHTIEFKVQDRQAWFNQFHENDYPLYVAELSEKVVGYCSITPFRPGRAAYSKTAEISYYLDYDFHLKGIGSKLLKHAISDALRIKKESLVAILLDINTASIALLEKLNFQQWGHLPEVAQYGNNKYGQLIFGLKISE